MPVHITAAAWKLPVHITAAAWKLPVQVSKATDQDADFDTALHLEDTACDQVFSLGGQVNKMTRIFLAFGLLSFAACGDDSLSEEDSQKGFMATNAVLAQGGAGAQSAAVQGLLSVDYTYNCIEGGSAKFVGELDDMSQDANTDATFNYTVTFDGCVSQGVSITGEMVYSLDVVANDTDATVEYSYVGNVSFGGDISGDCDLDVYAKFITSNTDTNASVSYEYRGNMCGNDADSLNASGTINVNIPQT